MTQIMLEARHQEYDVTPEVAQAAFQALQIEHHEERESSNYFEGRYFKGEHGGVTVEISQGDGDEPEFPISIVFSGLDETTIANLLESGIGPLKSAGFMLVRVDRPGRKDERRTEL